MILNKLDKRQKIVLALLGLVLIFLIWQAYGLFAPSSSEPAAPQKIAANPVAPMFAGGTVGHSAVPMPMPAGTNTAPSGAAAIDPASNSQAEYLRLVNEYQM